MDSGDEPVHDKGTKAQLRGQARKVYVESVAMALVLTGIVILLRR